MAELIPEAGVIVGEEILGVGSAAAAAEAAEAAAAYQAEVSVESAQIADKGALEAGETIEQRLAAGPAAAAEPAAKDPMSIDLMSAAVGYQVATAMTPPDKAPPPPPPAAATGGAAAGLPQAFLFAAAIVVLLIAVYLIMRFLDEGGSWVECLAAGAAAGAAGYVAVTAACGGD